MAGSISSQVKNRQQIAHAPGGDKKRRFAVEDFGGSLLQAIDGRVFTVHVVADLGPRHGFAHRFGGTCDRIAAKIDERPILFCVCRVHTFLRFSGAPDLRAHSMQDAIQVIRLKSRSKR